MGQTKHGMHGTGAYNSWAQMLSRCRNPKNKLFPRYGGRGIGVCERWLDFRNFHADMGDKPPSLSIDRIDNDGNYEPANCRWATFTEQVRNRSNNVVVRYEGRDMFLMDLVAELGLSYGRVRWRLKKGLSLEQALSTTGLGNWSNRTMGA